jgi:hypothetical protein
MCYYVARFSRAFCADKIISIVVSEGRSAVEEAVEEFV